MGAAPASVGLTLTLVVAFLGLGIVQASRWNDERLAAHRSTATPRAPRSSLATPARRSRCTRSRRCAACSTVVRQSSRAELRLATQRWLDVRAACRRWAGASGSGATTSPPSRRAAAPKARRGYRVFDRNEPRRSTAARRRRRACRADGDDVIAIRYIEPLAGNAAALGVNALSIPAARAAIACGAVAPAGRRRRAGFRLTQRARRTTQTGVVVYQAIYDGGRRRPPTSAAPRPRGVVFVTPAMDDALRRRRSPGAALPERSASSTPIRWPPRRRLAGSAGLRSRARRRLLHVRPLVFAGRQLGPARLRARPATCPAAPTRSAWPVRRSSACCRAAMLGALLLTLTGRTRRIESAVRERTAALRRRGRRARDRRGRAARQRAALSQHPRQRADRRDLHRPRRPT